MRSGKTKILLQQLAAEAQRVACAAHPEKRLTIGQWPKAGPLKGAHEPLAENPAAGRLYTLVCGECDGPPERTVELASPSQQFRRGEAVPAAHDSNLRRMHMTEEAQDTALARREESLPVGSVSVGPPVKVPTRADLWSVRYLVPGWSPKGKEDSPEPAVLAQVWALYHMGFNPAVHCNMMGGNIYVNRDGMVAHARAVVEARGEKWGRVVYSLVTDPEELKLAGAREGDTTVRATYQSQIVVEEETQHPDGSVTRRRVPEWHDEQFEWGRGNAKDTVGKTHKSGGGTVDSPIERNFPTEMARCRALRRMLKLMVGVGQLPQGVGIVIEGVPLSVTDLDTPALEEAQIVEEEPADETAEPEPTAPADDDGDIERSSPGDAAPDAVPDSGDASGPDSFRRLTELTPRPDVKNASHPMVAALELELTADERRRLEYEDLKGVRALVAMVRDGWDQVDVLRWARREQ